MILGTVKVTTKGQIVIPKVIRDIFGIKPSDKVTFEIQNKEIMMKPVMKVTEGLGLLASKKKVSDLRMKQTIKDAIIEKYLSERK